MTLTIYLSFLMFNGLVFLYATIDNFNINIRFSEFFFVYYWYVELICELLLSSILLSRMLFAIDVYFFFFV